LGVETPPFAPEPESEPVDPYSVVEQPNKIEMDSAAADEFDWTNWGLSKPKTEKDNKNPKFSDI